jgi:predicted acylesterase/phospholipase RssA
MEGQRDVAVVLSGGGINGLLLEVGFLKRLRESELWPRIGFYFGTSAGAVNACMAALDRVRELEEFILGLQPEDTFRPNRLWRLPLLGSHDYTLPQTIAERIADPLDLALQLAAAEPEVVAVVTDVTADGEEAEGRLFERAYSSKSDPPEVMAQAVLASAAISALVLPMEVGDRVATDGGWVRNYPLGYAYERPEVALIVGFRYQGRYPTVGLGPLRHLVARLQRYTRVPAARALVRELEHAAEREARGHPAHVLDTFSRLSRVAILRNTELEEIVADWREKSMRELCALRADVVRAAEQRGATELAAAIDERFAVARFPFRHDRLVPRISVVGSVGETSLEPGFRKPKPWTLEAKKALIRHGYMLTDEQLRVHRFA